MNIVMDTLVVCKPGLPEFSVKSLRLKPVHVLLEGVVFAASKFAWKWQKTG